LHKELNVQVSDTTKVEKRYGAATKKLLKKIYAIFIRCTTASTGSATSICNIPIEIRRNKQA